METLLVFLAIAAIQMLAAYNKQKKEAAKKATQNQKYTPPQHPTGSFGGGRFNSADEEEPEYEFEKKYEFEPEPKHEQKREPPIHATDVVHHALPAHPVVTHPVSSTATPLKAGSFAQRSSQFNLKDPGHGILWAAILHEPRYRVKWKRR